MKTYIRLALAQINCTVGDIAGNSKKIVEWIERAQFLDADIVSFPELAVSGYPPEDLLLKKHFVDRNVEALRQIARTVGDIVAIVGFADRRGRRTYNAAAVIHKGKVRYVYYKHFLPNYGVFDEFRYFDTGEESRIFKVGPVVCGINICEDIWHEKGPLKKQLESGAKIILNINASPYHIGKIKERQRIVQTKARKHNAIFAYTNMVGGQDELVFDGRSMIINSRGRIVAMAKAFEEDLLTADINVGVKREKKDRSFLTIEKVIGKKRERMTPKVVPTPQNAEEVYRALLLGIRDYVSKNGFKKVLIGLSGGIDSALVAALAADALDSENVISVFLPSRYSSTRSADDARILAANLGIRHETISIDQIFRLYLISLGKLFAGHASGTTEENLQARIRGNILMALSNKFGWLVLTTGNKSEMSTGYATLYGDMAGGFAVLKDVPKTVVYKLARYRNGLSRVIPESVLTKAPSAELRPGQKDSDTLPEYDRLDPIIKAYIEDDLDIKRILSSGHKKKDVLKVLALIDKSEYKRRQSPPGIRITPRAFGKDRRMPITNRFKEF